MGQFDINYRPHIAIKGQALTDFIVEFTYSDTTKVASIIGSAKVAKGVETKKVEHLQLRVKTSLATSLAMQNSGPFM